MTGTATPPRRGRWAVLADPACTPAAQLRDLDPDSIGAYWRLCRRPDLPAELVARMVARACREGCRVTQSAMGMHLTGRADLGDEHLLALATRLAEHEWNDRVIDRVLAHPRAHRHLLARLCWAAAERPTEGHLVQLLAASADPFTRHAWAMARALREAPAAAGVGEQQVGKLVRAGYLLGPAATAFLVRALPAWRGTLRQLWAAAATVAAPAST